ncbi:low-density lipoprotein receptor-related protein 4 [Culicoides brevitarsis]|uniref:low-density lipoprotein receptor-related protein 4 n=1 Tax=Culicoides brevitarsis TaxID=469753 RepID=UPI00307C5CDD
MFVRWTALLAILGAAVCDDTTTWPNSYHGTSLSKNPEKKPAVDFPLPNKQHGLNPPDASVYTPSRKKPQRRLDQLPSKLKGNNETKTQQPHLAMGVVKTHTDGKPGHSPPYRSKETDYSSITARLPGPSIKANPYAFPSMGGLPGRGDGTSINGPRGGVRQDSYGYDRYRNPVKSGKEHVFVPPQEIFEQEEDLIKDTHGQQSCDIKCEEWEFTCIQSCMCLHKDLRCDGNINCSPYAEDEKDCAELNEEIMKNLKNDCEKSGERILCPNTFICISNSWLCDGDDDCLDFSDETHCGGHQNCSKDQFECQNGLCIPNEWVCDSDNDCKDNSDELNCTRKCLPGEFQCGDGSCISGMFHCDGEVDCEDETDESTCDTPMPNCPEGEFKCRGSLGGMGGPGGRCVLLRYRCDGDNDCGDWSDEENCPKKQSSCTATEFRCNDGTCISNRWRCDLEQDCDSGEDEKGCTNVGNEVRTCTSEEFTCQDNRCILKSWICDGIPDCKRGEDEIDCKPNCEVGQLACPPIRANVSNQRICISQKHICDGHVDCPTGADEEECPIQHPCGAKDMCEQYCITDFKAREACACKVGFVLHENGINCTDIDECQFTNHPVCSQTCTNTYGSFICGCLPGYVLRPDLRTCKAMGGAVNLIMANRADIRQVSLNNNKYISLIKGLPNAISVDYHYKKNLLFWSDVSTDVIKRAYINGTMIRDVIKWGLESPGGIAVDWVHDLLFWTDSGTRRIEVSNFDGTLRAVVAANDLDKPRAIVVHPGEALVFFSDWGPNAKIERAYMDGSERRAIVTEGIFWPNGLAMDYTANRLYWVDAKHHVIESAAIDGGDRRKIVSSNLPHPFALTLFEDSIFWTDWTTKSISTASKLNGKGYRHIHDELHFPMDIHAYHPTRQPSYQSKCSLDRRGNRGGCSHLCLPNKRSRRCACPIGLTLMDDEKTCNSEPDKLLLVARKKDIRIRQLNSKDPSKDIDMVIPLDNLKSVVALDWCSETNFIYYTDVGRSVIGRAYLNGSNQETVIASNLISPAGLALDWVTQKLYFSDAGTNRIEVVSTDGRQRALLIGKNLDKPRDIVVSPLDGLMFFSDWGQPPSIEKAGMDGKQRVAIVSENLRWPNGLALDRDNFRLYFVDAGTKTLEYVNFDGTGRNRLIADGLQHPFGIDVHEGRIYYTDWETQSVQYADDMSGNTKFTQHATKSRRTIISNTSDLMDVRVFHRNRKDIRNPCSNGNGDCSNLCLLKPNGYSCACPIGILLKADKRTCESGPKNYVIMAHRLDIRQISLDIDQLIDVVLPLPPITNVVALDIDTKNGDIYYSDTEEKVIMRSSGDGRQVRQVTSESMDTVDGLVIDSVGRKIYWADSGRKSIEVSELDGTNRAVLLYENIDSVRGLAIDYEFGYLFFADWGANPRIERADMDGENRQKIVTADLQWPNCLSVDRIEKRLYWTDAKMNHIMSCDFEGDKRRTIVKNLEHPYGISVGSRQIFFTDWKTAALHYIDKTQENAKVQTITKELEGLMDVKVIEADEPKFTDICTSRKQINGGCSHLCLRKPNSYSCKCPTGIRFKEGSMHECEDLPKSYLLVALRSGIGRISLDTPERFDVVLPIDGVHGAVVLDFHYRKSLIFYADVNIDAIRSVNMLDNRETKPLITTGLNTPNGLAVDWIADNIYFSDSAHKVIEVARLDGSSRKTLLKENIHDPRAMILYPKKAFLFWADWATHTIERCLFDGSERKTIIDIVDSGLPSGLAIDFETRRLFWADALHDRIESANFDGKKRTQVVSQAQHPYGITIFGSNVYYTDWYNKSVLSSAKQGGTNELSHEIRHNLRGAMDIRAVTKERQPTTDSDLNPCSKQNGDCKHLCLYAVKSYTCACPDREDYTRPCRQKKIPITVEVDNDPAEDSGDVRERFGNNKRNGQNYQPDDRLAKIVVLVTTILVVIFILVVVAIIFLLCKPRRGKRETTSHGAVITYNNPNYNGVDPLGNHSEGHSSSRNIAKRLKYDKAQDRVYEVKCRSGVSDTATTILMSGTSSPSSSAIVPLSTIG